MQLVCCAGNPNKQAGKGSRSLSTFNSWSSEPPGHRTSARTRIFASVGSHRSGNTYRPHRPAGSGHSRHMCTRGHESRMRTAVNAARRSLEQQRSLHRCAECGDLGGIDALETLDSQHAPFAPDKRSVMHSGMPCGAQGCVWRLLESNQASPSSPFGAPSFRILRFGVRGMAHVEVCGAQGTGDEGLDTLS